MEQQLWFDKYRPVSVLSFFGHTEVFLTEHIILQELRVIKRVCLSSGNTEELRQEAEQMKKLRHPCIPRLLDLEQDDTYLYLVEEYMEGETLREYLQNSGPMEITELVDFSRQLCNLVDYLHHAAGGIIHGDLHPGNVIVSGEHPVLIDLGAAFSSGDCGKCRDSFGTRGFCAPELSENERRDERTDIYSLGCLIQYMQSGGKENRSVTRSIFSKRTDRRLKGIIERCTERIPAKRYRYADEVSCALAKLSVSKQETGDTSNRGRTGRPKGVRTIGLIGTHRSAGVTHTALQLAVYLHRVCHRKVAVIELSGHGDLRCYRKAGDDERTSPCRKSGIDIYPDADSLLAGTIRNGPYDDCIYDLGNHLAEREQELVRCDIKLILTDSADWHNKSREMIEILEHRIGYWNSWWVLLNYSRSDSLHAWKSAAMRAECLAYSPDPFRLTEQGKNLFRRIITTF